MPGETVEDAIRRKLLRKRATASDIVRITDLGTWQVIDNAGVRQRWPNLFQD
jgi:hypothetical protein